MLFLTREQPANTTGFLFAKYSYIQILILLVVQAFIMFPLKADTSQNTTPNLCQFSLADKNDIINDII
jgi:hypothetical protein